MNDRIPTNEWGQFGWDMGGPVAPSDNLEITTEDGIAPAMTPQASPYVTRMDKWGELRGKNLAKELHGEDVPANKAGPEGLADFINLAWEPTPEVLEHTDAAHRKEFIEQLMQTPEYKSLHEQTALNTPYSETAACEFATAFVGMEKEKEENERKCKGNKEKKQKMDRMSEMKAVSKAVKKASKEVQDQQDMEEAMGCGKEGGSNTKIPPDKAKAMFNRIKNNEMVRRICELAGRFMNMAYAKQRQKVCHGYDDMVGVVTDNDVGRLLPVELAQLADEDLELDFMRRFVERQTLCREHRGVEKVGKGPIVLCVDESSSMSGEPVCCAKAFGLALARIAVMQKRDCLLVSFAGRRDTGNYCWASKASPDQIMDWLSTFIAGGTDLGVPLLGVPETILKTMPQNASKTDIIVLTDGQVDLPDEYRESFGKFKAQYNTKLIAIGIGVQDIGPVRALCDTVHYVKSISVEEEGIQQCLSI